MIETQEVVIERVVSAMGADALSYSSEHAGSRTLAATGFKARRVAKKGTSLFDFALPPAVRAAVGLEIKAVIAATFSNEVRFPSLAVRIASALGLPQTVPAFDLQLACSAYPYAVYLASKLSRDLNGRVLVVDADMQSRYLDEADSATGIVMDDCATASVVYSPGASGGASVFDFYSSYGEALYCGESGPIRMDGFKVFSFVATEVVRMLKALPGDYDVFVPHRANMYMVRQLAKSIGAGSKLLVAEDAGANPGSSSIPLTLSLCAKPGRALLAGFGAGFSASAAIVTLPPSFEGCCLG